MTRLKEHAFRKLSATDNTWVEWSGIFKSEKKAKEWYLSDKGGQFWLDKDYKLGYFISGEKTIRTWCKH